MTHADEDASIILSLLPSEPTRYYIHCIALIWKTYLLEEFVYIPCSAKRFARLEREPGALRSLTPQRGLLIIQSNVSLFNEPNNNIK